MQPYAYLTSAPDEIYFDRPARLRDINVLKCEWMDAKTQNRQLKTNLLSNHVNFHPRWANEPPHFFIFVCK